MPKIEVTRIERAPKHTSFAPDYVDKLNSGEYQELITNAWKYATNQKINTADTLTELKVIRALRIVPKSIQASKRRGYVLLTAYVEV